MKFETLIKDNALIVRVVDTIFDVRGVKEFKRDVFIAIGDGENKFKHILINMKNVKMVDSTGLGGLLFAKRQADLREGKLYLIDPQPRIKSLIKVSKLEGIFQIVSSEEEAFEAFA